MKPFTIDRLNAKWRAIAAGIVERNCAVLKFTSKALIVAAGLVLLAPFAARADDVTDEIERARKSYEAGNIGDAKISLEMAAQLIGQQKAKKLQGILPAPLAGWSAEDGEPSSASPSMFGGGITASRTYVNGDKNCVVSVIGDSPMLAMVSMVLTNPSMASMSGARVQRIGEQHAMITKEGDVQLMSANNYLVSISGTCDEADKISYAEAIDYKALAGF